MTRASREQQLLDVAEELFLANGYERTSIEEIARAAGVTRPVVYEHYGSKEGIYLACVRRARAPLNDAILAAADGGPDLRAQIQLGADAYLRIVEDDPRRWELLFAPGGRLTGALAEEMLRERFRTVDLLADLAEPYLLDVEGERLDAFAHAVSGASEQVGRWWLAHPELPRAQAVGYLVDFVWPALQALARPVPRTAVDSNKPPL